MKRKRPKSDSDLAAVSVVWPLFNWELCVACGEEFRREYGWRHYTFGPRVVWRYVCYECCPTKQDALNAVNKYEKERKKRLEASRPGNIDE